MKGGADNIRNHTWYKSCGFQWEELREGRLEAPIIPEVTKNKIFITNLFSL